MGLYDWCFLKLRCPVCNELMDREWQTKDLGSGFREMKISDMEVLAKTRDTCLGLVNNCCNCSTFVVLGIHSNKGWRLLRKLEIKKKKAKPE